MQPHLAGTEPGHEPVGPGGPDQLGDLTITQCPPRRPRLSRFGVVVGAGGDRAPVLAQHSADRLDPHPPRSRPCGQPLDGVITVFIDERDQYFGWRSSSAAKKAEADFRIWLARRSSATSFFNSRISANSSVVFPGRLPPSISP